MLEVKQVSVQAKVLEDVGMSTDDLSLVTVLSETRMAGFHGGEVSFADVPQGQILFVNNSSGDPFMVAFVSASEIGQGSFVLTVEAIANGLIMTNPFMIGFSAQDRLSILTRARLAAKYTELTQEISGALAEEPFNLLKEAIFPRIYQLALELVIQSADGVNTVAAVQTSPRVIAVDASPSVVVGDDYAPYLSIDQKATILAVNPTMMFYGVDVDGTSPHVVSGKESLWQLSVWPPGVSVAESVVEALSMNEGNHIVRFSMGDMDTDAGNMGGAANILRASCIVLDLFMWCPVENETIKSFVETNPVGGVVSYIGDIMKTPFTPTGFYEVITGLLENDDVWEFVTGALYQEANDKVAAVAFRKSARIIIKAANKVIKVNDVANVFIPFASDFRFRPREVSLCANKNGGELTSSCQRVAPAAAIAKISPDEVYVGTNVQFDSSGSSDDTDNIDALMVRWDLDGNGIFDTEWTFDKNAAWAYANAGIYDVHLQVMDTSGLVGDAFYTLLVSALDAGGAAKHIKVFRDDLPWETASFEAMMAENGYTEGGGVNQYEILPSSAMLDEIMIPGEDLIIIMNDQDQAFYNTLSASLDRFSRFVQNGGVLLWEAGDNGWNAGSMRLAGIETLPGEIGVEHMFDAINVNINPGSVLMADLPSSLTANYASHEHFLSVPDNAIIYMEDTAGFPTLLEYGYGSGWIMLTGQPLEHSYTYYRETMGQVYPRLFNYMLGNSRGMH